MVDRLRRFWYAYTWRPCELVGLGEHDSLTRTDRGWFNGRPIECEAQLATGADGVRLDGQVITANGLETVTATFPNNPNSVDLGTFGLNGILEEPVEMRLRKRVRWWRLSVELVAEIKRPMKWGWQTWVFRFVWPA
jgi:hypothetical protein